MNSLDFRVLFLYEWKRDHNSTTSTRNISATFGYGSVNKRALRRWYAKFESGEKSLTNENRGRPETVVNNEVLCAIIDQNPGNTVGDYAKELGVTPTTIFGYLEMVGKVKKRDRYRFLRN
ncbi:histone-lysine N-methyltransferase SETMAR [Trichonephila clavipes]|nr:histone-lysine N-methyltransferase SETMAR [Trichonephila clavipes]